MEKKSKTYPTPNQLDQIFTIKTRAHNSCFSSDNVLHCYFSKHNVDNKLKVRHFNVRTTLKTCSIFLVLSITVVHNSNLMRATNFFFIKLEGQNWLIFMKMLLLRTLKEMIYFLNQGWRAKFLASAGHIWPAGLMLCMPDL